MTGEPAPFGTTLRRQRLAAGVTQEQLAELAGLSVRGIQDLERAARRVPHAETVRRLATALEQLDAGPAWELEAAAAEAQAYLATLTAEAHTRGMPEVQVGQVWEQVSKHERGMQLEVVRGTGRRWILRPIGGGPSKTRGLREGLWTLSSEQLNTTCRLVRGVS